MGPAPAGTAGGSREETPPWDTPLPSPAPGTPPAPPGPGGGGGGRGTGTGSGSGGRTGAGRGERGRQGEQSRAGRGSRCLRAASLRDRPVCCCFVSAASRQLPPPPRASGPARPRGAPRALPLPSPAALWGGGRGADPPARAVPRALPGASSFQGGWRGPGSSCSSSPSRGKWVRVPPG